MAALSWKLQRLVALALEVDEDFFTTPGLFDRPTYQTGFVRCVLKLIQKVHLRVPPWIT
jgi:hypothetical protein